METTQNLKLKTPSTSASGGLPQSKQNSKLKTVIIIAGPTAVGKTTAAIELARHFKTEIISADSRQCFKELNIGVARPTEEELNTVKHHFIASHSIHSDVNAGTFEQIALQKLEDLFPEHDVVIMTGGTGLYIKAFCEGMDEIPPVPDAIRNKIISKYEEKGLKWLQKKVKEKDPEFYKTAEIKNPQRLMRALEVMKATGKSILEFRKGRKAERDFNIIKIGLELPKEELYRNINTRVDKMMEAGLLKEVKGLMPYQHLNALQTVGYKELFDFFSPKPEPKKPETDKLLNNETDVSLTTAIELIKRNTRKFAKRQMTWFKKDKDFQWLAPDPAEIIQYVKKNYARKNKQ